VITFVLKANGAENKGNDGGGGEWKIYEGTEPVSASVKIPKERNDYGTH
jgi:hypothetical protein